MENLFCSDYFDFFFGQIYSYIEIFLQRIDSPQFDGQYYLVEGKRISLNDKVEEWFGNQMEVLPEELFDDFFGLLKSTMNLDPKLVI